MLRATSGTGGRRLSSGYIDGRQDASTSGERYPRRPAAAEGRRGAKEGYRAGPEIETGGYYSRQSFHCNTPAGIPLLPQALQAMDVGGGREGCLPLRLAT